RGRRRQRAGILTSAKIWKTLTPVRPGSRSSTDRGMLRMLPNALWDRFPRTALLSRTPVRSCTAGLQEYSAGVEPEPGHVRADLVLIGDVLGAGAVVRLAEQQGAGEQEAA